MPAVPQLSSAAVVVTWSTISIRTQRRLSGWLSGRWERLISCLKKLSGAYARAEMLHRNRKPWGSAKKTRQARALANPLKADMVAGHMAKEATSKAQDKAEAFGCEYRTIFLHEWYKLNGCAACGRRDSRGFHAHHTEHRSRKGTATSLVCLCPSCHTEDKDGIEENARKRFGVDLFAVAEDLAERAMQAGYLPVEQCDECGEWHSARFLIDELDKATGEVRRICEEHAPAGPI